MGHDRTRGTRACATAKATSRWAALLPLAAAMTVQLALAMQAMIAVDAEAPPARRAPPTLDVTPKLTDTEAEPRPRPVKPDDGKAPPPIELEPVTGGAAPDGSPVPTPPKPRADPRDAVTTDALTLAVQPTPVLRMEQRYPAAALRADLEGRCTVAFDILATGGVANVRVTACSHRAFAREALRAVSGYRYTPSLGADGVVFRGARIELVWALPD